VGGTLYDISREELEAIIADGRIVIAELLKSGTFNIDPWLAEVEPLIFDRLELEHREELDVCRAHLEGQKAAHLVLDTTFRLLSVLETIETTYEFKARA